MYPDRFFLNLWNRIPYFEKWAFFSCMASGILAHFYMLANKLPDYDDINNLISYGAGVSSGRFFLDFLGGCVLYFFGNFSMPWLYGILSIFFLSVASAAIVCVLDIKGKRNCFLIGAVMPVFPSITATFFFMYTVPYYTLAICLTTVSVLIINKYSNILGFAASAVMLALSLGIYQAYIPLAAGMMVLLIIKKCLSLNARCILADMACYLMLLGAALGLYLVLNKTALHLYGQEMDTYKGLDQMGRISLAQLAERIRISYCEFFQYFFKNTDGINPYPTMRFLSAGIYLLLIAGICTGIVKISRTKSIKSLLPCMGLTVAIKLTDGYDAELPLVIIGDKIEDASFYKNEDFERYGMSGRSDTLLNEYSRDVFWKKYNGFDHLIIEDKSAWESLPMVQAMPCYPQNGSIQVIDGAIVLKLQETD